MLGMIWLLYDCQLIVYNSLSVNEIELMKLEAKVIGIQLEVK